MIKRDKREIYCEYRFWEAFFEMEDEVLKSRSRRRLWDAFYAFLSSNRLYFDIPNQSVNEATAGGKNLMEIRRERGGANIKFIPKSFPRIDSLSNNDDALLNAVYLTVKETAECKSLSMQYGVMVLNQEMVFDAEHIFLDNGQSFSKANGLNWTYLQDFKCKCPSISCCNSLIIVDRYLLYDTSDKVMNANLRPIFDALLPFHLKNDIVFTICIISEKKECGMDNKLNQINVLVHELRPELKFVLNIYGSTKFHDRSILTNNILLTSGAGFDVIGANDQTFRLVNFTSLIFPFLVPNQRENSYLYWMDSVLLEEKKIVEENRWGNRPERHHLLDFYYEEPEFQRATYTLGDAFAALGSLHFA